jgi:hypothetical protein
LSVAGSQQQQQQPTAAARPGSANVYSSYDPTHSPIGYSSPTTQQTSSSSVLSRISKANTTSPTPAQAAWSLRQVSHFPCFSVVIVSSLTCTSCEFICGNNL